MKKLLFVLTSYPSIGGVETVTINLSEILYKDYEIYTLALYSDPKIERPITIKHCFQFAGSDIKSNIEYYNALIKELEIDCVINMGMYPYLTEIIFNPKRDKGVRIVSLLHGLPGNEKKQYWLQNSVINTTIFKKLRYKALAYFNLNSEYRKYVNTYKNSYKKSTIEGDITVLWAEGYLRHYINEYSLHGYSHKIISIPNPLSKSYSAIYSPSWEQKENIVVYVGKLTKEKRLGMLIDVWKKTKHAGWKLVIVGDGPIRKLLEMKSIEADNIVFVGSKREPAEYYKKSKLVVQVALSEGFGMSLLEGMRYGAYPISFDNGYGVKELLSDGGGTVLPAGDVDIMSAQLENLFINQNLVRILGMRAYKKSKNYTSDKIGVKWLKLFYNILNLK